MYESFIGKQSKAVKNVVERGAVKKFALAIGDGHPLYIDEEVGKASRFGTNIAPPTFARTFDFGVIEGLELPEKGLIHGAQSFTYKRPLLIGEEVLCRTRVKKYFERKGKLGSMGFLILEDVGESLDGSEIFRMEATLIISEAVGKAGGSR